MENTVVKTVALSDIVAVKAKTLDLIFAENGSKDVLEAIEERVNGFKGDVSTAQGRKEIASFAFDIARSKTFLDDAGKKFIADIKDRVKVVDAERKKIRDRCDELKEIARKPLTDWEAEQEEKARIEREKIAKAKADEEARLQAEALAKQQAIDEENARKARELAEQQAKIDEQNRLIAEEKAKIEAEKQRLIDEANAKLKAEIEAKERAEREERIRLEAIEAEKRKQAEREAQLLKEKEEAIAKAKADAEAEAKKKEDERIAREEKEKDELQASNKAESLAKERKEHRKNVESKIFDDLKTLFLMEDDLIQALIKAMRDGEIKNVTINY